MIGFQQIRISAEIGGGDDFIIRRYRWASTDMHLCWNRIGSGVTVRFVDSTLVVGVYSSLLKSVLEVDRIG